jgi:dTDP-glucose pyrophosphorylase
LRRLYPEARLEIEITDVRQNYEEDQELESSIADETEVVFISEAEEAMMAVALQNQASV